MTDRMSLWIAPLGTYQDRPSRWRRVRHWFRHRRPIGLECERCWQPLGWTTGFHLACRDEEAPS